MDPPPPLITHTYRHAHTCRQLEQQWRRAVVVDWRRGGEELLIKMDRWMDGWMVGLGRALASRADGDEMGAVAAW